MYGKHIGTLNVKRKNGNTFDQMWSKSGNQGDTWKIGCIPLPAGNDIELSFEAVKGSGPKSDIAIDDVEVTWENCAGKFQCIERTC